MLINHNELMIINVDDDGVREGLCVCTPIIAMCALSANEDDDDNDADDNDDVVDNDDDNEEADDDDDDADDYEDGVREGTCVCTQSQR